MKAEALVVAPGIVLLLGCADAPPETRYGGPDAIVGRTPTGEAPTTATTTCGDADVAKNDDPTCKVKWAVDLFPKFRPDGRWKCSAANCHERPVAQVPAIPVDSPKACWAVLRTIKVAGKTYLDVCSKEPADSALLGNLRGQAGTKMPIGADPATAEELTQLETWLRCGAPFE